MKEMVIGRYSICWDCGEKFILDPMNMKKDRPICRDCEPKVELPPEIANILLGE
jgi:formylmethanofuran dehydrogenase subunit E